MDGEGPALAVGFVGRGVVQRLAVVQRHAAGREGHDGRLGVIHHVSQIEQRAVVGEPLVFLRAEVCAWQKLHRAVVNVHIVQRQPAAHQVGRGAAPVGVVLVPERGAAVAGRFVQRLVVEKLDVRSDQVFDHVQNAVVVEQAPKVDVVFAHLHDLKHLLFTDGVAAKSGMKAVVGPFKLVIILPA